MSQYDLLEDLRDDEVIIRHYMKGTKSVQVRFTLNRLLGLIKRLKEQ